MSGYESDAGQLNRDYVATIVQWSADMSAHISATFGIRARNNWITWLWFARYSTDGAFTSILRELGLRESRIDRLRQIRAGNWVQAVYYTMADLQDLFRGVGAFPPMLRGHLGRDDIDETWPGAPPGDWHL